MAETIWCQALMREVLDGKPPTYDMAFKHAGSASTIMNSVDGNDLKFFPWNMVGSTNYPPGGNPYQSSPTGVYDLFVHEFVLDHPGSRPGTIASGEFVSECRGESYWNGVEVGMWPADWDDENGVGFPDGGHGWVDFSIMAWDTPNSGSPYQGIYVGGNVWQTKRSPIQQDVIDWLNSADGNLFWLEGKNHPKDASGNWKYKAYWPEDDPRTIVGIGSTCPGNQHMGDKDKVWVRMQATTGGENDGTDGWQRSWIEVGRLGVELTLAATPIPDLPPPPPRVVRGTSRGEFKDRQVSFPAGRY